MQFKIKNTLVCCDFLKNLTPSYIMQEMTGKITSAFLLSSSLSYRCGFTVQSASKTAIIHSENKVGGCQFGCKDGKDCQNGQLVIQQPVKQLLTSISLYRSLFLAMVLYKKYINRCEFACKSWSFTITVLCNKYSTFIYKKKTYYECLCTKCVPVAQW